MKRRGAEGKWISDVLLDNHGIYVQPINYPTVPCPSCGPNVRWRGRWRDLKPWVRCTAPYGRAGTLTASASRRLFTQRLADSQ